MSVAAWGQPWDFEWWSPPHCPPTPWQAANTQPWHRQGPPEAHGENTSTHGRAWLHGGGSRKGCQHVASLPREAKTSEFGPCQPIPQLCHHLWEQHIPVRAAQGRRGDGPWEWQDGESGHKSLELLGERKRGRRAVSRAEFGRDPWRGRFPLGACLSSRTGRERAHQSFRGRPNK